MAERPYTVLSCGVSIDGYLDSFGGPRLVLSNDEDLDRVDAERAMADAILVGAATVRRDNPRLLVRSSARREDRVTRGLPPSPVKVTVTRTGDLDPCASFFIAGDTEKIVYCTEDVATRVRERLRGAATVVDLGAEVEVEAVGRDLERRGVTRLMVEGGGRVHTQFLASGLVDELQLAVAPVFVGDSRAPRFVSDGEFPWHPGRRATLADVRRVGDVVLLRYALSPRCEIAGAEEAP